VPRAKVAAFAELAAAIVPARYSALDSVDYTSIIDERSFDACSLRCMMPRTRRRGHQPAAGSGLRPREPQDRAAPGVNARRTAR